MSETAFVFWVPKFGVPCWTADFANIFAIASVVICKGDNGRWQPNYSNVLGNLAAAGISNVYCPASDREGAELTVRNSLIGKGAGAVGALFQEFLFKRISRGVQH